MKIHSILVTTLLGLAAFPAAAAASNYFVQPIIIYGGSVINGLEVDGATSSTQSYYNAPAGTEARADLGDGTLKAYVDASGGLPNAVAQSRLGDTMVVRDGAGTSAKFSMAFDGSIKSDPITPNLNSSQQVSIDAYIAVYDASAGANEMNWSCFLFACTTITPPAADPLGSDRFTLNFNNHTSPVDRLIDELLSVTFPVVGNNQSFKVFANLTLNAARNANPGGTIFDFLNTANLGLEVAPGATFASASGVFPGSQPSVVPLPAAAWMLLAGIGALGLVRRRG